MNISNGLGLNGKSRGKPNPPHALTAPAISGAPTIAGTAQEGAVLSAAPGAVTGKPTPSLSWQWRRSGVDIQGATGVSHALTPDDVGETLTVVQTATNTIGTATAESAPTLSVVAADTAPAISGAPTIAGTAQEGAVLSAAPGAVTGKPTPSLSWQWRRSGVDIQGATGVSHALTPDDVGETLTVVQTATNTIGTATAESAPTLSVVAADTAPAISGAPTIAGTAQEGAVLSAAPGAVTGKPTPSLSWQWRRSGVDIQGATGVSHALTPDDVGETLTVVQTATNTIGTATAESAPTLSVVAADTAPAISGAPTIAGTAQEGAVLSAAPGAVTGKPTPSLSWQWRRSGVDIQGATGVSHALTPDDVGETLTVVQTATNTIGTATAESAPTLSVVSVPVVPASAPVLSDVIFDDATDTLSFTTTEGGTLHWAIYQNAGGALTLNSDGTWVGITQETGSETVPTSGSGSLTPSYSTTTGDRLAYGIIGAADNVSSLVIETFTPSGSTPSSSLLFDDDLTGANGQLLSARANLTKVWTSGGASADVELQGNAARRTLIGRGAAYEISGITFASNQYVGFVTTADTFNGVTTGQNPWLRLYCRDQASNFADNYSLQVEPDGTYRLQKRSSGSTSELGTGTQALTAGDTVELRVSGTSAVTVAFYLNNMLVDSATDTTSPFSGGQPGCVWFDFQETYHSETDRLFAGDL